MRNPELRWVVSNHCQVCVFIGDLWSGVQLRALPIIGLLALASIDADSFYVQIIQSEGEIHEQLS